jgi:hypothetical protein
MAKVKWEINCYEAKANGTLVIHLEDDKGVNMSVVVPKDDVDRLMYAAIDALQKKPERR